MELPSSDPALDHHLGALLAAGDAAARARILLAAAERLGRGVAWAVWRRVGREAWRPVLERGPDEALPEDGLVARLLAEPAGWSLPSGTRLVRSEAGAGWALVLAEAHDAHEGELDELGALLAVAEAIEAGERPAAGLDAPLPPLPPGRGPGGGNAAPDVAG